jgi:hypothetical protein
MEIKRSYILVAFLLAGSVVAAATITAGQAREKRSTPENENAEGQIPSDAQRWEYCSVSKAVYPGSIRAGVYWITYLRSSGQQSVDIEDNATSNAALAKAIGRLGDEGWEMVGVGPLEVRPNTKVDAYYFKRPKQRP